MTIIKLYNNGDDKDNEGDDDVVEPVIVDSEGSYEEEGEAYLYESKGQWFYRKVISFIILRMIMVFIGSICFFWAVYNIFALIFKGIFYALTLFSNDSLMISIKQSCLQVKLASVACVGLLIALVSPSMGVSLIASYCLACFQSETTSFFLKFLQARMKDFEGH